MAQKNTCVAELCIVRWKLHHHGLSDAFEEQLCRNYTVPNMLVVNLVSYYGFGKRMLGCVLG